jgi:hypothetical protein
MGKTLILLAICLLSGCSALSGPDVERSFLQCLQHDRDATYTVSKDWKKVECKR